MSTSNQQAASRSTAESSRPPGPPYAQPRIVTDLAECYFYHTMEVPGYGLVEGEWDLRQGMREYLGGVDLQGKRVLEIGTASGFCCFAMERQGAEVVAYDLSPEQSWDLVPFARQDSRQILADRKRHIGKLNNAYWLTHRAVGSKAKVVYGSVYAVPEEIGPVDVATVCCVLLHLRDPFYALQNAARLTREKLIVVDAIPTKAYQRLVLNVLQRLGPSFVFFLPDPAKGEPRDSWWMIPEDAMAKFLKILGFERIDVSYHSQMTRWGERKLYTMVGHRTAGSVEAS